MYAAKKVSKWLSERRNQFNNLFHAFSPFVSFWWRMIALSFKVLSVQVL